MRSTLPPFFSYKNKSKMKRSKFVLATASIVAGLGLLKLAKVKLIKEEIKTSKKFLTQDGNLVEIDIDKIQSKGHKVSLTELKNWVFRKSH